MSVRLLTNSYSVRHAQIRTRQVRLTITIVLYSARTELHMSSKIVLSLALYSARTKNAHVDEIVKTLTLFGTHKTRMVSKADVKSRTLFGTQKTHMSSKIASSFAHIQHAQKTYMSSNIALSPALYSARSENALVEVDWLTDLIKTDLKSTNLAWSEISHVKWKWLRKSLTLINTYVLSKIDFKSRTLFGTLRISHVEWEWLLALYSARSENARVN